MHYLLSIVSLGDSFNTSQSSEVKLYKIYQGAFEKFIELFGNM